MFDDIKNKIEQELPKFIRHINSLHSLSRLSGPLFTNIQDFILRPGKRIRPALFAVGYLGFAKKIAPGLYRSALSLELLHDFMLVHDDVIDKSDLRRGKPSMHQMFNRYLKPYKNIKFSGGDLAIVAADVIYALALEAFLSIKVDRVRKEAALKKLIEAVIRTGSGEFIELLSGIKSIETISKKDIYRIYDYKTAYYTFAAPLAMGAILAGAPEREINKLLRFGMLTGRAFQIKDDILGIFSEEEKTGKSILADLREAKKTILIWYAYNHSARKNKLAIKRLLSKKLADKRDLLKIRKIIAESGAWDYAKREIAVLINKAQIFNANSKMRPQYRRRLQEFAQEILGL